MKIVADRYRNHLILVLSVLYLALNLYLIVNDFYGFLLIPIFIIIIGLYLLSSDVILLLITALTPLSVSSEIADSGFLVSWPTEPLLIGITALFILKFVYDNSFDKRILKHPISILVGLSLCWMLISSITSEIPVVSFKYLISRLWFVIPFYFMAIMLFKRKKLLKLFSWLYVIPLIGVIIYSIYRHAQFGFSEEAGHWVMNPFFNDHTANGAMLAFFIPVFIGYNRMNKYSKTIRWISFIVSMILILALILSFSRAAWLSLVIVFFIFLCIRWKIKFRWIGLTFSVLIIFFYVFQKDIVQQLEKNSTESSENYVEHIKSIYNISSDASNLERINRWQSAIRMFKERPIVGWGPGSYQFVYAPYQRLNEKTIISSNTGDKGNAHSEYLGPLAEMGIPGFIFIVMLVILSIKTGIKIYQHTTNNEIKMISLVCVLALSSYFIHGLLNNFLDTDKASIPVWGFIAMIVAMDIFHKEPAEKIKEVNF